jgi:hypothetical protein
MKMTAKILIKSALFISFFIVYLLISDNLTAQAGENFSGTIGISAGYDNNVSLSSESKGSSFISYRSKLDFRLFPKNPTSELGIFAEGMYREYLSLEDNYRLRGGGYLTWQMAGGRLIPGIFGDISAYRDKLNPADEKDGFTVGAKVDWIVSARLTLGIQQAWTYQNYDNPSNIYAHRDTSPQMRLRAAQAPIVQPFAPVVPYIPPTLLSPVFPEEETQRNEWLRSTSIRGTLYFMSDLKGEVSVEYVRSDFSVYQESYAEKGASFSLIWTPNKSWEISPLIYVKQFDYNAAPDGIKRDDTERGIGLNISYFFKAFEVFVSMNLTDNNSELDTETYQRTVTQCGIIWSF